MNAAIVGSFYALSGAMIAVAVWFIWRQHQQGRFNLLAPANMVMISFALQFGISNYPAVVNGEGLFYRLFGQEKLLIRTMVITLGAMILFGFFYLRSSKVVRRRWAQGQQKWSEWSKPKFSVILWLYLVGLAARLLMIRMGVYSYLIMDREVFMQQLPVTMVLGRIERLCNFSLIALAILWCIYPKRYSYKLWLGLIFLTELFFNFLGGTKGLTLINFFYVALVYWYIRGNPPRRWILGVAMIWALITPWNLAYRDRINEGFVNTENFASIIGTLRDSFKDAFLSETVSGPIERLIDNLKARIPLLQEATLVMDYADRAGYSYGEKYLMFLPIALIPRFLWPDKPVLQSGYWVTTEIYGQTSGYTSTAITGIGDFYLDFGIIGPLLGFALWGVLIGWIEARFEKSALGVLLITGLYINLINIVANDTFGLLGGIIKDLVILLPFCWATGFGLPFRRRHLRAVKQISKERLLRDPQKA